MAERMVVVRKWGNSMGVALPSEMVKEQKINPNDRVMVSIRKIEPLEKIFGTLKTKESTEEIMKEIRKGWD